MTPALPPHAARYVAACQGTIAELRKVIADLETSDILPGKKRRLMFRARAQIGQIECAAEQARITHGSVT